MAESNKILSILDIFRKKKLWTEFGEGINLDYPNDILNLRVPDSDRKGHSWCFGTTRVGKTRLLENIIEQDIRNRADTQYHPTSTCAIGPELETDPQFDKVAGEVRILRAGACLWSKAVQTGESVMCHSLANIEHHHFKYAAHRRPGY